MAKRKRKKKISEELIEERKDENQEEIKEPKKERPKRVRPKRNPISVAGRTISFKGWFTGVLSKERRLRPHHFSSLLTYMQGLGYGSEEIPAKYDKGLESYFGK